MTVVTCKGFPPAKLSAAKLRKMMVQANRSGWEQGYREGWDDAVKKARNVWDQAYKAGVASSQTVTREG